MDPGGTLVVLCIFYLYIRIIYTFLPVIVGVYNVATSALCEISWFYEEYTSSSIQQVGEKTDQSGDRNYIIGRFLEFACRCPILFW